MESFFKRLIYAYLIFRNIHLTFFSCIVFRCNNWNITFNVWTRLFPTFVSLCACWWSAQKSWLLYKWNCVLRVLTCYNLTMNILSFFSSSSFSFFLSVYDQSHKLFQWTLLVSLLLLVSFIWSLTLNVHGLNDSNCMLFCYVLQRVKTLFKLLVSCRYFGTVDYVLQC